VTPERAAPSVLDEVRGIEDRVAERRRPGRTVAQLAAELDVDRTALYRVIRRLEADGRVVKEGATVRPA
jgi:transposase-like protein